MKGKPRSPVEDYCYLVGWPEERIVKAGVTYNKKRWRMFECRGAFLFQLQRFRPIGSTELEVELHDYLRTVGTEPWATKDQAEAYLGPRGGGWTECYRLPDDEAYISAVSTCVRIMLEHAASTCALHMHERTNERRYLPLALASKVGCPPSCHSSNGDLGAAPATPDPSPPHRSGAMND